MEQKNMYGIDELLVRYPALSSCKDDILKSFNVLKECFSKGNKLLVAGNGGSCADAEHIVGELMKGFKKERRVSKEIESALLSLDKELGKELSQSLQPGLPAIALSNHQGLNTAFINDVENGGLLIYAQQILTYGKKGDVFLALSTSGNSKNIYRACLVAKAKGLKIIGLSGAHGGLLKEISDVCITCPATETFMVQEYHLPIYHCLCLMLENHFFN